MSEACATTIVDLFQEFNALPVGETSECRVEIVHLYLFKRKNISKNIVFWDVQGLCGNRIEVLCKGEKIGGPLKSQVMDQALAVDIGSVVSVKGYVQVCPRGGFCILADCVDLKDEACSNSNVPRNSSEEGRAGSDARGKSNEMTAESSTARNIPWIAFDLSFNEHMNEVEANALSRQLTLCYAANQKSPQPCNLLMCGLGVASSVTGNGAILHSILEKQSWSRWNIKRTDRDPWHWMPMEKVTYLSADSPNVLQSVESGHLYCIGGLVDHKILLLYYELKDWSKAIARCPAMHCAPVAKYVTWKIPHNYSEQRPAKLI
ncbi:hypothetical protein CYMTET_37890 [Cymbomonas tetramitiformis]|uniref:tRNA (guanine(9)-N(1))-methyltransferase n=1 Tax=Cymbomonas tetramitiformis TaxID=36881 RepID=A0AAE0F605_9CHLO|nr:hypothetical protein CYMTET_37890 [Cymbomonas tetramitiformis]